MKTTTIKSTTRRKTRELNKIKREKH